MSLKEKIEQMIEQYSTTKDNPTVLRALERLSALVQVVIDWIDNNDPVDFSEELKVIERRMSEIQAEIEALHLETINEEIAALQGQVETLTGSIGHIKETAEAAKSTSEDAVETAGQAEAKASKAEITAGEAQGTAEEVKAGLAELDGRITAAVTAADKKAEAATETAENAAVVADEAKSAAESAEESAGQAVAAAGEAKKTAQDAVDAVSGKQDRLVFDQAPTAGSSNPVTSDGIYKAIQTGGGIELDDTVTADSQNGVKSSGIYTAIERAKTEAKTDIDNIAKTVAAQGEEIDGLQEFQETQEETNKTHNEQIAANKGSIDRLTTKTDSMETEIAGKQGTLTFDETPTEGSSNPVTSDGVYKAIQNSGGSVTLDDIVTEDSKNGVKSSGIWAFGQNIKSEIATEVAADRVKISALETGKQDNLTFDQAPTQDSENPITSGGVKAAMESMDAELEGQIATLDADKQNKLEFDEYPTEGSDNMVNSGSVYEYVNPLYDAVNEKQDKLTFDQTPTQDSKNPVTSGGIYKAIQESGGSVKINHNKSLKPVVSGNTFIISDVNVEDIISAKVGINIVCNDEVTRRFYGSWSADVNVPDIWIHADNYRNQYIMITNHSFFISDQKLCITIPEVNTLIYKLGSDNPLKVSELPDTAFASLEVIK